MDEDADGEAASGSEEEAEDFVDLCDWRVGCAFQWIADHLIASEEDKYCHLNVSRRILYATRIHFGALEDQADRRPKFGAIPSSDLMWNTMSYPSTWTADRLEGTKSE